MLLVREPHLENHGTVGTKKICESIGEEESKYLMIDCLKMLKRKEESWFFSTFCLEPLGVCGVSHSGREEYWGRTYLMGAGKWCISREPVKHISQTWHSQWISQWNDTIGNSHTVLDRKGHIGVRNTDVRSISIQTIKSWERRFPRVSEYTVRSEESQSWERSNWRGKEIGQSTEMGQRGGGYSMDTLFVLAKDLR